MHHSGRDSGFHDGGDVRGERIVHCDKIHPDTHELKNDVQQPHLLHVVLVAVRDVLIDLGEDTT